MKPVKNLRKKIVGVGSSLVTLLLAGCVSNGLTGSVNVTSLSNCDQVTALYDGAQYDNFAFNFATADRALAEVLAIYDDPSFNPVDSCPANKVPSKALVLASRALALSNQEQFFLAERLLAQAEESLTLKNGNNEQVDTDDVLILNTRIMHARNVEQSGNDVLRDRQETLGLIDQARAEEAKHSISRLQPLDSVGEGIGLLGLDRAGIRRIISAAATDYLQSGIALSEGNHELATSLINSAIRRIDRRKGIGSGLKPRFLIEKAKIQLETAFATEKRGEVDPTAYQAALSDATDAVERIEQVFPNRPILARAILIKAKAQEKIGDLDAARKSYKQAFAIYQENPAAVSYESVWSFLRLNFTLLDSTADTELQMQIKEDMFDAAQIIRSSTVAKEIATSTALADVTQNNSDIAQLVEENRRAEEEFRQLTVRNVVLGGNALDVSGSNTLKSQLDNARERLKVSRIALGLEGNNAVSGAEEYLSLLNKPASLESVQESLQPREALVQVLAGEPVGTVFVIGQNKIDVFQTNPQGLVPPSSSGGEELPGTPKNYANAILENLRRIGEQGRTKVFNLFAARQAYEEFFSNASQALREYDTLVFSLSGALASLPMEVLITEDFPLSKEFAAQINEDDYRSVAWLAKGKSISYVPSPRNLVDLRGLQRTRKASKKLAIFSGYQEVASTLQPQETEALLTASGLNTASNEIIDQCSDLAEAVINLEGLDEDGGYANAIAEKLDTKDTVFAGPSDFTAKKLNDLSDQLDDFQILHFNTHGILWPSPDCFSEPALTINVDPSSSGSRAIDDRLLTASEIQKFDLAADLVVLSACDTAGGDGLGGESLSGLARSFFIAGTRALVASHWKVSEDTTNSLMQDLYLQLSQNDKQSFRSALTSAQETLRTTPNTSHPYYWAPFVLIGDGSTTLVTLS